MAAWPFCPSCGCTDVPSLPGSHCTDWTVFPPVRILTVRCHCGWAARVTAAVAEENPQTLYPRAKYSARPDDYPAGLVRKDEE